MACCRDNKNRFTSKAHWKPLHGLAWTYLKEEKDRRVRLNCHKQHYTGEVLRHVVHYYLKLAESFPAMRTRLAFAAGQAELPRNFPLFQSQLKLSLTSAPRGLRLGFQLKWTQIGWRIRIKVTRCMPCVKTCEMEEPVRPAILCCDRPLMNRSLMMAFNNWGLNVISDLKPFLSAEKHAHLPWKWRF